MTNVRIGTVDSEIARRVDQCSICSLGSVILAAKKNDQILETLHTVTSCNRIRNLLIMLDDVEKEAFGCAQHLCFYLFTISSFSSSYLTFICGEVLIVLRAAIVWP